MRDFHLRNQVWWDQSAGPNFWELVIFGYLAWSILNLLPFDESYSLICWEGGTIIYCLSKISPNWAIDRAGQIKMIKTITIFHWFLRCKKSTQYINYFWKNIAFKKYSAIWLDMRIGQAEIIKMIIEFCWFQRSLSQCKKTQKIHTLFLEISISS